MKHSNTFSDRRKEAEASKKLLVDRFKAGPPQEGSAAAKRTAARQAQSIAQAARNASLEQERQVAQSQQLAADAIQRAEQKAADDRTSEAAAAQETLDEAARKEKRDARYASRKARR